MSRVAKKPIDIPPGVEVKITSGNVEIKGKNGVAVLKVHTLIKVTQEENTLHVEVVNETSKEAWIQAGTLRSLLNNAVIGVNQGFEKKLQLVGVGYRAQSKGKVLILMLGFSHPVEFSPPEGISIETPSQTEVVVKGFNKHHVGQVAAKIRSFRPPEPYKGKGVRYVDERIISKEPKKK